MSKLVVDTQGVLRRETQHSMLRRFAGWNYKGRGIYQITITLADRASQALGALEVKVPSGAWVELAEAKGLGLAPDEIEARIVPSAVGRVVEAAWRAIPEQWPGVKVLRLQLMPDHIHGIIFFAQPIEKTLGNIVGSFKSKSTSAYWSEEDRLARESAQNGSCALPRAARASLWSPGYQDTVLLHEGQLANMFRYLADNPRRRAVKALWPALFRVVGELKVALPGLGGAVGHFVALGNRFLLGRVLAQVQCSRSIFGYKRIAKPGGGRKIVRDANGDPIVDFTSPEFDEKRELLFAAAKRGAVLISPCVSDGEREIARLALKAELPLVALQNKGFAPLQKPSGRYFGACSAGRLLMLAPRAWPYQPGEKTMTRDDATAMNRLCQWIVGEDAAEINYHGMKPINIDELARAAAEVKK